MNLFTDLDILPNRCQVPDDNSNYPDIERHNLRQLREPIERLRYVCDK